MRKSKGPKKPQGETKVKKFNSVGRSCLEQARASPARPNSWPGGLVWWLLSHENDCRAALGLAGTEPERIGWYPKDGELCLSRMKPEETLVEVRSDSDVQIDRRT